MADRVRTATDKNLTPSTVSHERIDLYVDTFAWRRREYCATAPVPMLNILLAECDEIQGLAAGHHPAAIARRLSELTANYATLIADALMKLGEQRSAHAWYATATIAADDSGEPLIRAQVRAQTAMLPYYYGHLAEAVRLAREAQMLTRGRACSAAALAAAAEDVRWRASGKQRSLRWRCVAAKKFSTACLNPTRRWRSGSQSDASCCTCPAL